MHDWCLHLFALLYFICLLGLQHYSPRSAPNYPAVTYTYLRGVTVHSAVQWGAHAAQQYLWHTAADTGYLMRRSPLEDENRTAHCM